GKPILRLAADVVPGGQHFGGVAHVGGRPSDLFGQLRIDVDVVIHRHMAHVLDATAEIDAVGTGGNGSGCGVDGLHGGAAEPVHGLRRHAVRQAGQQRRVAADVPALLLGLLHTTPDNV